MLVNLHEQSQMPTHAGLPPLQSAGAGTAALPAAEAAAAACERAGSGDITRSRHALLAVGTLPHPIL